MRGNPSPEMFDEIAVKFIVNLPKDELTEQRIGFHFEKAYFYYLDTLGLKAIYSKSDRPKQIVTFCNQMLRVVSYMQLPKLSGTQIAQLIQQNYAVVPVNGVIIMNMEETHVLMVESRDNKKCGFPKGKSNEGQSCQNCAIREVREEIGLKLDIDPKYYVDVEVQSKLHNRSFTKWCRFFICKVQETCIVARKCQYFQRTEGVRSIIHSATEICSIGWYRLGEQINSMISKDLMNTPSKLALFELMKKLNRNLYKEKKQGNPLDQFKGFDKNLAKIFEK